MDSVAAGLSLSFSKGATGSPALAAAAASSEAVAAAPAAPVSAKPPRPPTAGSNGAPAARGSRPGAGVSSGGSATTPTVVISDMDTDVALDQLLATLKSSDNAVLPAHSAVVARAFMGGSPAPSPSASDAERKAAAFASLSPSTPFHHARKGLTERHAGSPLVPAGRRLKGSAPPQLALGPSSSAAANGATAAGAGAGAGAGASAGATAATTPASVLSSAAASVQPPAGVSHSRPAPRYHTKSSDAAPSRSASAGGVEPSVSPAGLTRKHHTRLPPVVFHHVDAEPGSRSSSPLRPRGARAGVEPEAHAVVMTALTGHFFFSKLGAIELDRVVAAMERVSFDPDDVIVAQGSSDDTFFVVGSGHLDVYVDDEPVGVLGPGKVFGELALLYDSPRAAKVVCGPDPCTLWRLDRASFRSVLASASERKLKASQAALKDVPLLKTLKPEQLSKLAHVAREVSFVKDDVIIRKGDIGDCLYCLMSGSVVCKDIGTGVATRSLVLEGRVVFGERALVLDEPRAANVVATADTVTCLTIDRHAVTQVLGDLGALLDHIMAQHALRSVPVLAGLTDDEYTQLATLVHTVSFVQGAVIAAPSTEAVEPTFYVVREGRVTLARDGTAPMQLGSGDYFGELQLLEGTAQPCTATATTTCTCLVLTRSRFLSVVNPGELQSRQRRDASVKDAASRRRQRQRRRGDDADELPVLDVGGGAAAGSTAAPSLPAGGGADVGAGAGAGAGAGTGAGAGMGAAAASTERSDSPSTFSLGLNLSAGGGNKQASRVLRNPRLSQLKPMTEETPSEVEDSDSTSAEATSDVERAPVLFSRRSISGSALELLKLAPPRPDWTLDDFHLGPVLGVGTFGRVRLVRHKTTGALFALKSLLKQQVVQLKQQSNVLFEKAVMSLEHPFLLRLHATFQTPARLHMVLEFIQAGELFSLLSQHDYFPVDYTRFYAACVVEGLSVLHARQIVYRDIKPENLLIDKTGYLKIIDFGFAKHVPERTYTLCGTPEYLAPEVVLGTGQSVGTDYWALGVLMYEMLCGTSPFSDPDQSQMETFKNILQAPLTFPSTVVIDEVACDLIEQLLSRDEVDRIGCRKGGIGDIRRHGFFASVDFEALLEKRLPPPWLPPLDGDDDISHFDEFSDDSDVEPDVDPEEAKDMDFSWCHGF